MNDNPRVCGAVLTWNMFATGRAQMFEDTLASLQRGDYPIDVRVVTNGATEQATIDRVQELGGIVDERDGIWLGMVLGIEWCVEQGADLVVFSADDGLYADSWLRRLVDFWRDMPSEVKIVCPVLSPSWPPPHSWNTVRGYIDGGGMRGLIRDSVPGSFWTFRAEDWPLIKSLLPEESPGEDLIVCRGLIEQGYMVAEVDLCEHAGALKSAWGNLSYEWAIPLDRARWGV